MRRSNTVSHLVRRNACVEEQRTIRAHLRLAERRARDIAVVRARKLRFRSSNCTGGAEAVGAIHVPCKAAIRGAPFAICGAFTDAVSAARRAILRTVQPIFS